jgi:hypothetical protein
MMNFSEGRKASPIEMPRASSSNSQPQQRRTTPSDNQYRHISPPQNQPRQITPPQNHHRQVTPPENLFVPMPNRATAVQPQPFRSVTSRPAQRGTVSNYELPKLKPFYSEPIMYSERRKSKKTHTKRIFKIILTNSALFLVEDLATVCGMLRNFREYTYKGSLRETQYRLQRVEEAQRMSSRM